MPSKRSSGGQRRAQGGGRVANSEPKLQVFRDFAGVNFEHANMSPVLVDTDVTGTEQTDLQMNYVLLQNNVAVVSNKTLETRDDIIELFKAEEGHPFTGPVKLIGPKVYAAKSNGNIGIGDLDEVLPSGEPYNMNDNVVLDNKTGSNHTWTSLDYYDNKLIALTSQNEMWTGDVSGYTVSTISNAMQIPNPTTDFMEGEGRLIVHGDLDVYQNYDREMAPYRVEVAHTFVNKYGSTKASPKTRFYANHPVSEWHSGRYLELEAPIPEGYDIKAVEVYYATDNAMDMIFCGHVDVAPDAESWSFNWYGYVDATSMWPIANLVVPTENYTKGVHASRVKAIDGRLYFWGDSSNKQRLYIGGNPGNLLSVSPGTGGGFVDVEPGTGQAVRHVCKYKTQSGNSIITMLCASPNTQKDQRYNLVENSISLSNEQSMKSWQAEQVAGAIGCKSFDGALVCEDGLYSISRYGLALTTMTMEYNAQIRTNYVSDAIKPVFTDTIDSEARLDKAILLELDNVIYMALGIKSDDQGTVDNVIFCYDIDLKAWWTYTLDVDVPILNLFHVDWQGNREGIGIVTKNRIYMLPTTTTQNAHYDQPDHSFLIKTSQLSTQMPQQGWQWLSQLEFHFDNFVGTMDIQVRMFDMFGRELVIEKQVSSDEPLHDYVVHMRIDQRVMSYVLVLSGQARFRMSHFIARVYTLSNKIGQVWGFDDSISYRSSGDVQQTFECYNDIRKAIFT